MQNKELFDPMAEVYKEPSKDIFEFAEKALTTPGSLDERYGYKEMFADDEYFYVTNSYLKKNDTTQERYDVDISIYMSKQDYEKKEAYGSINFKSEKNEEIEENNKMFFKCSQSGCQDTGGKRVSILNDYPFLFQTDFFETEMVESGKTYSDSSPEYFFETTLNEKYEMKLNKYMRQYDSFADDFFGQAPITMILSYDKSPYRSISIYPEEKQEVFYLINERFDITTQNVYEQFMKQWKDDMNE